MKTTCTSCGKKYSLREDWIEYNPDVEHRCVACALESTTAHFEEDQECDGNDLAHAYEVSGQSIPEDDREEYDKNRSYPEESDDEREGHHGWSCDNCHRKFELMDKM